MTLTVKWKIIITLLFAELAIGGLGKETMAAPGFEDEFERKVLNIEQERLAKENLKNPSILTEKLIDINTYTTIPPEGYSIGIIVDPCKNRDARCCHDTFGTPTYTIEGSERYSTNGAPLILDAEGNPLLLGVSRLADRYSVWDEECFEDASGAAFRKHWVRKANGSAILSHTYNDPYCVARHKALAKIDDTVLPACWDRNTSVNAMSDCQSYDGLRKPHCIAIAYTITNYVVQCGRHFIFDNHCGIFMELHKAGDDTILSQTRMLGEYPSGYRTTTLPLYYKDRKRIVCRGNYEIWWVQRTKYNFIIQHIKPFYVQAPICDFDTVTNLYADNHFLLS